MFPEMKKLILTHVVFEKVIVWIMLLWKTSLDL